MAPRSRKEGRLPATDLQIRTLENLARHRLGITCREWRKSIRAGLHLAICLDLSQEEKERERTPARLVDNLTRLQARMFIDKLMEFPP